MAYNFEVPLSAGRPTEEINGKTWEVFTGALNIGVTSSPSGIRRLGFLAVVEPLFSFKLDQGSDTYLMFKFDYNNLKGMGLSDNEEVFVEIELLHASTSGGLSSSQVGVNLWINGNRVLDKAIAQASAPSAAVFRRITARVQRMYTGEVGDPALGKWKIEKAALVDKEGSPILATDFEGGFVVGENTEARVRIDTSSIDETDTVKVVRLTGSARLNYKSPQGADGSVKPVIGNGNYPAVATPIQPIGAVNSVSFQADMHATSELPLDVALLSSLDVGLNITLNHYE